MINWDSHEVKKRMLKAAARAGLEVGARTVDDFENLKNSWEADGSRVSVRKLHAICCGDCEGKKNQQWSRKLETEPMNEQDIVCDQEPSSREKGGCKVCISHTKGSVVRQTMNRSRISRWEDCVEPEEQERLAARFKD